MGATARKHFSMCIYHGNCADGFAAAWAIRKALPGAKFVAAVFDTPPPDVTGEDVVMVDFSYPRPVLLEMASKAKSLLILDHHKSASEDLRDLPENVVAVFDMERSGAMMAWQHFFPDVSPPNLIAHIQDGDLLRYALQGTHEICSTVFSYPYDFQVWERLMCSDIKMLREEGIPIERAHQNDIAKLLKATRRRMVIADVEVPVANLPFTLSGDAALMMAQGEPFAACYWDTPGKREFILRSCVHGHDVGAVARQYGGGGHLHAAGFRIPLKDPPSLLPSATGESEKSDA